MTAKSNQHSSNGIKHLKFNLEKANMKLAYQFLSLLDNSCSSFIADLICSYLKTQGIHDLSQLSKEDAKRIARSAGNASINPPNYNILNAFMSSLLQVNQGIGNPAAQQIMPSTNIELKGKVNDEVPPVEPPKKKVTKEVPVPKLTETENFPFSEIDTSIENEFLTHDNIDSENEYIDDSLFSGMSDLYN